MPIDEIAQSDQIKKAVSLAQAGAVDDAIAILREVLRVDPSLPLAHHNLAVALASQAKNELAIASFSEALRLAPHYAEARLNFAKTLLDIGDREKAVEQFRCVLLEQPDNADALNSLGLTLTQLKSPSEGAVFLQHALRVRPDFPEAHNNLGLALADLARFADAEASYVAALKLRPKYIEALTNLASAYAHQHRFPEAMAQYELALFIDPKHVSARWNRSLALLHSGDFRQGWTEYEWRHRRKQSPMRPFTQPMWDGTTLDGKTILLWCEQGLGDTIQFCRYASSLKEKGAGQVVFECPSPLLKIMARFPGVDQLVPEGQQLPAFHVHAPLMSLPRIFETTIASIPSEVPYLKPQPDRIQRWSEVLTGSKGVRVGLAWQGNPHHQWDRHRSIPLATLSGLAKVEGVSFYSLQRGPGVEQLAALRDSFEVIELLDPAITDAEAWADVAAIMVNLDLVITVDTATAHIAGALGVRTWLLLSALCDWRWMLNRQDTPWYPMTRLFRQEQIGDWTPVVQTLVSDLSERATAEGFKPTQYAPVHATRLSRNSTRLGPQALSTTGPLLTVLLGCYGDYPQYSLRAIESIIRGQQLSKHCEVLVGMNECGPTTIQRVRQLASDGIVNAYVESSRNLNKDPMLRLFREIVRTPYLMWLDDDSHFTSEDWPTAFAEFVRSEHPFDAAGQFARWGPRRDQQQDFQEFLRARPWWRTDRHYPEHFKQEVPFVLGGMFLARTDFLRKHDFPDSGMTKWLDDVLLGELVLQADGRLVGLDNERLRRIKINDGERRGHE